MYNAQKSKSKSLIPKEKQNATKILSFLFICVPIFIRAYVYTELHTKHTVVYLLTEVFTAPVLTITCLFYMASTQILEGIQAIKFRRDAGLNTMINVYLCGRLVPQLFGYLQNQSLIGPYNSLLYVLIIFGLVVVEVISGIVMANLTSWLIDLMFEFVLKRFDKYKSMKIRQMIQGKIGIDLYGNIE